jgi:hypothetical protein
MFSSGFGSRETPRTYQACERVWKDKAIAVKRHGRVKLGNETYLHQGGDRYYVTFHGNTIVRYYPEYKTIHGCGWEGSPTTQMRISALTNVPMRSDSSKGYKEPVRVDGYPYFPGMRIDNYGCVFDEDKRPDYKEVVKKEIVQQYVKLFRKLSKLTLARWELGEWKGRATHSSGTTRHNFNQLLMLEEQINAGETFLDSGALFGLFNSFGAVKHHDDMMKALRDDVRRWYYAHYDGYKTLEVK